MGDNYTSYCHTCTVIIIDHRDTVYSQNGSSNMIHVLVSLFQICIYQKKINQSLIIQPLRIALSKKKNFF